MTKSFIDGRVVYEVKLENPEKVVSTINFMSDSKYKRMDEKTLEKVAKQSKLSLLFFENPKTSEIAGAAYMNLESTQGSINEKWSYRNLKDFTGRVFYHSFFNGDLKDGYSYREGKTYERASPLPLDGIKSLNELIKTNFRNNVLMSNKKSNSGSTYVCGSFFTEVYKMACVQAGTGPLVCGLHYAGTRYVPLCAWVTEEEAINWIADEPGGGGPGYIIVDCNGDWNGTASDNNECNICIGGNTGYTSCADYKNQITDPCLKDLVNEIISAGIETEMGGIISYLDQNTELSVIFIEALTTNSLASAVPALYYPTPNGIKFETYISLSPALAKNFSKEYVASIILHEILHAYFNSGGPHPNPLLNQQQQHDWMRTSYIEMFTDFLANNYGIPKTEAAGLAISHLGMWSESGKHTIDNVEYLVSDLMGLATQHMRESVAADQPGALGSPLCN